MTEGERSPCFHLHEDELILVGGDQVDLGAAVAVIGRFDGVAQGFQVLAGQSLAAVARLLTVGHTSER